MSVTDARGGLARDCDPTAGAAIAHVDEQAERAPGSMLVRKLTFEERERIRKHIDLDARRRAVLAGAKVALHPEDADVPRICKGMTEAGGRCTNQAQVGRAVCGVHRRQLAA